MVRSAASPRVSNHAAGDGPSAAASSSYLQPTGSLLRAQLYDFIIAGKIVRTLAIGGIHHDALAILQRGPADERTERRLVIDLAEGDLAERRRNRQSFRRRDQLFRI